MKIHVEIGCENINWGELCELIRSSSLGIREPERLEIASKNSFVVCAVYVSQKIIGFGRALSDGQYQSAIYDVVVSPVYQKRGIGKLIMEALMSRLPKDGVTLIYVAPGKQIFYEKQNFKHLKTGMGLFPNPNKSKANGYIY
ncbi:GNAT family N-acetyltransferase [Desulforhopalus sp. IMCC35007]|uniref:GNAT family N-acetyltransferase n=1 Tax=Desulforhopalus sp. IMCC35007 TaxID=2569543 RepID=UPI0010AE271D|nr:GNAT family N-acetyltransferase [Desulforhopalus sp. IMCC35007]TKB08372.1 GNAT family N-acetyltransferase [Desulforhopalus sp. IMCC35007]